MNSHKSIRILNSLSSHKRKRFKLFLASPYFNTNAKLLELYELLYPYFPVEESQPLPEHSSLFKKLYPQLKKESTQIAVLFYHLQKQLEQFLSIEELEEKQFKSQELRLESLAYTEGLEDVFLKNWTEFQTQNEQRQEDSEKLAHGFRLEALLASHLVHNQERHKDKNLSATLQALENYLLLEYFRYSLATINLGYLRQEKEDIPLLTTLLAYVEQKGLSRFPPLVQLYYCGILCLKEEDSESFYVLFREKLLVFSLSITAAEAFELYKLAINYLIRKNRSTQNYLGEIFEYYQDAEEKKLFYQPNGLLDVSVFTSIVTVGVSLSNQEKSEEQAQLYRNWVMSFIDRNQDLLPQNNREYAVRYAKAFLYFFDKNFEAALKILPEHSKDAISEITRRRLQLRIYYELGEFLLLNALCESSHKYLQRANSLASSKKSSSLHFLRLLEKLIRVKQSPTLNKINKLLDEIQSKEMVEHRVWLKEKLIELKSAFT